MNEKNGNFYEEVNIGIREIFCESRKWFLQDVEKESSDLYRCFYKEFNSEAYRTSVDLYFLQCIKRLWQEGERRCNDIEESALFKWKFTEYVDKYCDLCKNDFVDKELLDGAIKCLKVILQKNDDFEQNINSVRVKMEQGEYLLKKRLKEL